MNPKACNKKTIFHVVILDILKSTRILIKILTLV